MRYLFGILLVFLTAQTSFGQTDISIPSIVLPIQDNEALRSKEMALRSDNRSPEFAIRMEQLISPDTHGRWLEKEDGHAIWQLQIESPEAYSLNFGFTKYNLPTDATLLIYPPDKRAVYGPFTAADNEDHTSLWTPIMQGDAFIIEVNLPAKSKSLLELQLQYINHDFLGFSRVISGDCHIDAICGSEDGWPQLDEYRDVMQSVGLVSVDGRKLCTGFLINNGREDCTPYFITANHCGVDRENARSMVVYWNYQNSYCRTPNGFQSSRPGDGILETYNTGAFYLASAEKSDFTLVRLDDPIVEDANAFLVGWNVSEELPQDGVFSIHHPLNKEKRVAISSEIPFPGKWNAGDQAFLDGDHLIVPKWTQGTTEDGSSGAPLFNSNKQVIGQLHGGRAGCGNENFDAFGWLRSAWLDGETASSRLKDWLDPDQQGLESLNGRWAVQCEVALVADLAVQSACLPSKGVFTLTASDAFAEAIQLELIYAPSEINIELDHSKLAPGANTSLFYEPNIATQPGVYTIVIRGSNSRDTVYADLEIIYEAPPLAFDITTPKKSSREIIGSATLNWYPSPNALNYQVSLAKDPGFKQPYTQVVQSDTFLIYDQLDFSSTYFWKVQAFNNCGETETSIGEFRTAPDIRLLVLENSNSNCINTELNFQLQLGSGFIGASQLSAQLNPDPGKVKLSFGRLGGSAVLPGDTVDIQISNTENLPIGSYELVVTADDGVRKGVSKIPFEIRGAPYAVPLLAPFENWVSLTEDVHFRWGITDSTDLFHLEVADYPDFNKIIAQERITGQDTHLELSAGQYYWRIRSENACGTSFSEIRKVSVYQHDQLELNGTQVFIEPTPSLGALTLRFSNILEKASVQVRSIQGQLLLEQVLPESYISTIDLSRYPSGVYLIRIQARRSSITKKIILQK